MSVRLLNVAETADLVRKHPVTIRRALEAGEMHGHQRVARGRWTVDERCALAWAMGEPCAHQLTVAPVRALPLALVS